MLDILPLASRIRGRYIEAGLLNISYEPVVQELNDYIHAEKSRKKDFQKAIDKARSFSIREMDDIRTTKDYLDYINALLRWVPSENVHGRTIYDRLAKLHFILDQAPVRKWQNAIRPHPEAPPLTWLSAWMVRYAQAMGAFMDTPESLTPESLATFRSSPNYNLNEYLEPRGRWRTFNDFFARSFKPGYRPIAAVCDQTVVVNAADSTFDGQWEIRTDSHITLKGLHWQVSELMEGSPYQGRFQNGIFMHAFLGPTDYHRLHAPVGGTVLEARVIPGQVYLQVEADAEQELRTVRVFDAPDDPGYQFAQARGLIVLDTPIGLVAVLPIGMTQVSSVVVTAEVGVTVRKGEELAYFQFGGSDIVLLFEAKSNVSITAQMGVHYKMGTRLAQAYPVL